MTTQKFSRVDINPRHVSGCLSKRAAIYMFNKTGVKGKATFIGRSTLRLACVSATMCDLGACVHSVSIASRIKGKVSTFLDLVYFHFASYFSIFTASFMNHNAMPKPLPAGESASGNSPLPGESLNP